MFQTKELVFKKSWTEIYFSIHFLIAVWYMASKSIGTHEIIIILDLKFDVAHIWYKSLGFTQTNLSKSNF